MGIRLRNMVSVYIRRGTQCLLLYRIGSRVVAPSWCGIGGHFEKEELNDPQKAMLRELEEEVGLTANDLKNIKLRYVTFRLKNGEIRQNYYYFADLRDGAQLTMACDEGELKWTEEDELPFGDMPHTASYVMKHYMETGRGNDIVYAGASAEKDVVFQELAAF